MKGYTMEDFKSAIAGRIVKLRTENGWTQLELAEKLHYSDKAVSKWERGESLPELTTLVALAELFDVTLDELVRGISPAVASNAAPIQQRKKSNRAIITAMSILLVWFVASLVFVILDLTALAVPHWLAFVFAVPVSAIVWLILNAIWFNTKRNYPIISVIMWSVLASIHVSFLPFGKNIWQIYLLGATGQLAIVLWSRMHGKQKKPK